MKVAVIGAGISGLAAARLLDAQHDVTLFEAGDYAGGHTNTLDVELDAERHAIDTGFIVFNDWTYPHFTTLLDELGVASRPTTMGFSVRCDRTGLEYNGSSLNGLFADRRNLVRPTFHRMLRDIMRFNREAPQELMDGRLAPTTTVAQFLREGRYSRQFADHYLLPMGSAIWSCPTGTFAEFPIRFIVEFYRNHGLLSLRRRPTWRIVTGGSRTYVSALLRQFRGRLRLRTPIGSVRRHAAHVAVSPRGRPAEIFGHVVFACHSDQALGLLADPSPTERQLLGAFPYERNIAVLHTDSTALPHRRRAWASWNYHVPMQPDAPASVTYCMNILQHIRSRNVFCVTLNGEERIDPARVLARFVYEHPVFTTRRTAAQARHSELINVNRTSYCGAYWGNGFHEDGVVSARAACRPLVTSALQDRTLPLRIESSPGQTARRVVA